LQLHGRAAQWWNAMVRTGARDTIFNSSNVWTAFVEALRKEFQLIDVEQHYRDKMWGLKQITTVQQFVDQLRNAAMHIPNMLSIDREMRDRFEHGLREDIKAVVRQAGAAT